MFASAIAYVISSILAIVGILVIYISMFTQMYERRGMSIGGTFLAGIGFLSAAWVCAHFGGI